MTATLRRHDLALAAILAGAGFTVFTLWLALGVGGLRTTVAVDDIGEAVAAGIAAAACVLAAARASGRRRLAWGLLGAAALSWTAGEVAWTYIEVGLGQAVPFPSLADMGFLGSYPLLIAGLLCLPLAPSRAATRTRSVLDGAIVALSLLFIGWALVLGPVYAASASSPIEQLLGLAYPVGDVVTATVVVIIAGRASGPERLRFLLLLGGFLAIAIADSAFAYLTGAGDYTMRGSVFDAAWVGGFLLIGLAALWPAHESSAGEEGPLRSWQVALPAMAFAGAAATSFVLAATGRPLDAALTTLVSGVGLLLVSSHLLSLADAAELRRANAVAEAMLRRLDLRIPDAPPPSLPVDRLGRPALAQVAIVAGLQRPITGLVASGTPPA